MTTSRATADTYLGVDISLPGGRVFHCDPLTLERGIYWAKVRGWSQIEPEDEDERRLQRAAQLEILEKFPAEISPDDGGAEAFESLLPAEVYTLIDRFLAYRRPDVVRGIDPAAAADVEEA